MNKKLKIALIGASGQLGTDLQKIIPQKYLVNLDYPNFDITDKSKVKSLKSKIDKYDLIINTAAYNLVDCAEEHPQEALVINYHGTANLVDICLKLDVPLMHFSTDYVFGADKNRKIPYTESDKPGPLSEYGKSKLLGEQIIQQKMKKYFIVRTSGLFGVAGSAGKGGNFIESVIKRSQQQDELEVVDDQILTPTYTLDLARQVWQLIQTTFDFKLSTFDPSYYGLYHMTAQGECSWHKFTQQLFKYLDKDVTIKAVKTIKYNLPAARPYYSVLVNKKLQDLNLDTMRPWQEGLKDYLTEKGYIK